MTGSSRARVAPTDTDITRAVARVPGLAAGTANDLRLLLHCVHEAYPAASTVLAGSLAFPLSGRPGERHDIDLYVILPTRREALGALRSPRLRERLDALRLGVDAELVVLWTALVERGQTSLHGRVLVGDHGLERAIARSPASPFANLYASAHVFLIQSLVDADDADRLVAKAVITTFRAWLRDRPPLAGAPGAPWTMADLFSPVRTARALEAARDVLPPGVYELVATALARQRGEAVTWDGAGTRGRARRFLESLAERPLTHRIRRLARHAVARLHFGMPPLQIQVLDPLRIYAMAVRAVVAASAAAPEGPRLDPLDEAELLIQQLIGARTAGPRRDRVHSAARVLAAYGRHYPHKILVPALPPVPPPAAAPSLVSFVVPCRDGAELPALLASIERQEVPPGYAVETVVVAAGAVVAHESEPGAAAARNTGIRRARGDTLVFVDADVRLVGRDFLHHTLRALSAAPEVGLVGAAIECAPGVGPVGRADHMVSFFDWQSTQFAGRRLFQPSAALAVRRAVCEATGGFAVGVPGLHDVEFCRRARAHGWVLAFEPGARVEHVPRRGLGAALTHAYRWGWSTRRVYAPTDRNLRWWFLDRPWLFALNVPGQLANRLLVVTKRWLWRRPLDTVVLFPLLVALLGAWGAGVAVGGWRSIRDRRDASDPPRPGARAAA